MRIYNFTSENETYEYENTNKHHFIARITFICG